MRKFLLLGAAALAFKGDKGMSRSTRTTGWRALRLGVTDASRHKLREDAACLRWLLTGKAAE